MKRSSLDSAPSFPSCRPEHAGSILLLAAFVLALTTGPLRAQETTGESRAFGTSATYTSAGVKNDFGEQPVAEGSAPPAYDVTNSAQSTEFEDPGTGQDLSRTGEVEVRAASEIPVNDKTLAYSYVENAETFGVAPFSADSIEAYAEIGGSCAEGLTITGTTTLRNARVRNGPLGEEIQLEENPDPNTVAYDQDGVRIVLNEQFVVDGATTSIVVNGVHIYYTNALAGGQLYTGDVIFSHSEAAVTCGEISGPSPDLRVTTTHEPQLAVPGETLTTTVRVQNIGGATADQVELSSLLPGELTDVTVTPPPGVTCSAPNPVVCDFGDLPAGADLTLELSGTVEDGAAGSLSLRSTASTASPEADTDDNSSVLLVQVDRDDDGVADGSDNCPDTANANQRDGDGDGVGDVCDNCPSIANADQADVDRDGMGNLCDEDFEGDADRDGIPDGIDNCPFRANEDQDDGDGDGVGDVCDNSPDVFNSDQADRDSDGVGDASDNCPQKANPGQSDVDGDGTGDVCDGSDSDGDGRVDSNDNCPAVPNPDQRDSDGDGVGDVCFELCTDLFPGRFEGVEEAPAVNDRLDLYDGRFLVETFWTTRDGTSGKGVPLRISKVSGYFWFFEEENLEISVKVLDACGYTETFWVFLSGLTDLGVTVRITDQVTGQVAEYTSPQRELFQPMVDLLSFDGCNP